MSDKASLSNAELELTQRIQLHFPRGVLSPEELKFWNGCEKEVLSAELAKTFSKIPELASLPHEPVLDFLVRVDRSVKPSYPDWMKKLEHPELECSGPAEYDLQTGVYEWFHDNQKTGVVSGNTIHKKIQRDNTLGSCLNLQDGLAIQAKGIAVFRKLFAGKAVFLWGSVVQFRDGRLNVPFLCEHGDGVVVFWSWLGYNFGSDVPALRFCKQL